ncbi:nitroreductase family deazaflavin-dependent oxidoreductase [Dactylosporangium maewongense]|uniref:Nitroreductase family deazaflavin-dependent oxidoreductase n=1 Tax=Dactylosporangium maewongense TaxID=634393 RepID=A0ABN2DAL8_9ACTN
MTRRIPRLLARSPIPLYRQGLGWLFGPRMAMLEHRGRRSGQLRHVVLEVLERDARVLVVVSGYGRASQWFRNIEVDPGVRIWTGRRRGVPARAEILSAGESRHLLERYRDRHPRAAARLGRILTMPDLSAAGPLAPDVGVRLPMVRIRYAD